MLEQLTADEFAKLMPQATGLEVPPSAPAQDRIGQADAVLPRARLPPRGSRKRRLAAEVPTPRQSAELEASNRSLCEVAMELAVRRLHGLELDTSTRCNSNMLNHWRHRRPEMVAMGAERDLTGRIDSWRIASAYAAKYAAK